MHSIAHSEPADSLQCKLARKKHKTAITKVIRQGLFPAATYGCIALGWKVEHIQKYRGAMATLLHGKKRRSTNITLAMAGLEPTQAVLAAPIRM